MSGCGRFLRCGAGWHSLLPCLGFAPPILAWLGGWRKALAGRNGWKFGVVPLILQEFGDCSPSLSSLRAVPGFGVSLILGVQLCRRGDPSLGRGKEQGVMPLCFRMLVLFLFRGRARLLPWYFPY